MKQIVKQVVRQSWTEYFFEIAEKVGTRASCDRLHVGAIIVKDKRIIAEGYNGSLPGEPSCDEIGHLMINCHCVSGNTVIPKFQGKRYNATHHTIKEIHKMFNNNFKRLAHRMIIRTMSSNGTIVPSKISETFYLGRKRTYEVTTLLGRKIRVTPNHKFFSDGKWIELRNLHIGDLVALNGRPLYENKEWLIDNYIRKKRTQEQLSILLGVTRGTIKRRLKLFRIPIRSKEFGGWNKGLIREQSDCYKKTSIYANVLRERARRYALTSSCEICGSKRLLQVHHIDENIVNDSDKNLVTLCAECHNLAHTKNAKRVTIVYDQIRSIKHYGFEDVYDLNIANTHNYIGNGFVIHNCQRTVHGEANAIASAAKLGISINYADAYVTHQPCYTCFKLLKSAGINNIFFAKLYGEKPIYPYFLVNGIYTA